MKNVIVAKTLVFDEQKRVLLLVRSDDDVRRAGGFDLPGGKIEQGESPLQGVVREALEEAGLVLDPDHTDLFYTHTTIEDDYNDRWNVLKFYYVTKVVSPEVRLSHEHSAYGWYTIDEALEKTDHATHKLLMSHLRDNQIMSEYWS
jgi:8-oxo-dGTP pyrophosphatase MutT (NUDIX family)